MSKITLRKIQPADKKYLACWWRDKELLELTSGILRHISDNEVDKYFQKVLKTKVDYHFTIVMDKISIGLIFLRRRRNEWYETQIVIGEKKYWGKGYGTEAVKLLIDMTKQLRIFKMYLEVRPTNTRAIHAYERCGFRKIKIINYPQNTYLSETLRMELVM